MLNIAIKNVALNTRAPNSLIHLLLQSGADPHLSDRHGGTVLYFAVCVPNVWAIKWLVLNNVDLTMPVGGPRQRRPVSQYLLDHCEISLSWGDKDLTRVLDYLRAMQVLAIAWTNQAENSFLIKPTQTQLIDRLHSIIPKSIELSEARCFRTYEMVGEDLREIRDIVHTLTDMLSNPLTLRHLCRIQVRRSLGREFRKKLDQLNVPLLLQEYLWVYKESDLAPWFPMRI